MAQLSDSDAPPAGRDRAYAAITIGGLALGLAGCLLILTYVNYERSYDRWLPDSGRIYQVQDDRPSPGDGGRRIRRRVPFLCTRCCRPDFPQIEAITSIDSGKTVTEHDGQPMFLEATTVAPEFFPVFALPFARARRRPRCRM